MKYFVRHLSVSLLVLALAAFAFGKDKTKTATVTFTTDVTVGGTLVKQGEYKVKFNEESGELTVIKGNKVVAKTTATVQDRTDKTRSTTMEFRNNELVSIAFGSAHQEVVIGQGGSATGNDR